MLMVGNMVLHNAKMLKMGVFFMFVYDYGSVSAIGGAMCCHILTRGRRCRRAALFKEGLGKPKACYTLSDVTLPEFRVI